MRIISEVNWIPKETQNRKCAEFFQYKFKGE